MRVKRQRLADVRGKGTGMRDLSLTRQSTGLENMPPAGQSISTSSTPLPWLRTRHHQPQLSQAQFFVKHLIFLRSTTTKVPMGTRTTLH